MTACSVPGARITLFSLLLVAVVVVGCPAGPGNGNGPQPNQVMVPNVVGMTRAEAESSLAAQNLSIGGVTTEYSAVEAGRVVGQNPSGGRYVDENSAISLVISKGPAVNVPNVAGMMRDDAEDAITGAGLVVGAVTEQRHETTEAGRVISQDPAGGTRVDQGVSVALVVSKGPEQVNVPDVVGMPRAQAEAELAAAGLALGIVDEQYSDEIEAGHVIHQNPLAGTLVDRGAGVALVVSEGPRPMTVPNVVGMRQADAESAITGAHLIVGTLTEEYSTSVKAGDVIRQEPLGGTRVPEGSAVDLWVSKGPPEPVNVPSVVGMARAEAEAAIIASGLAVGAVTEQFSDTVPAGEVISQQPEGDTLVDPDGSVDLVVSRGPAVSVPGVVNRTQAEAESAIRDAGLTVGTVLQEYSDTVEAGNVIRQYPVGDTLAAEGSSVNLVVSRGPAPKTTVPNVLDMMRADAEAAIRNADLTVGAVTFEFSDTVEAGRVISQNPVGGTVVNVQTAVNLVVAQGFPVLAVTPDSITLTEDSTSAVVTVSNTGPGTLRWTASRSDTRITVSPNSWSANSREVTISAEDFTETYAASVTFTNDDNPSDSKVVEVTVSGEGPVLDVSPREITLRKTSPSATVTVTNIGTGTLSWTASSADSRVTVSPGAATGNSTGVTISTEDFSEGKVVEVTFTNDDDSSNTAKVSATIIGEGPFLDVNPDEITLTEASPSAVVDVSNIGGGTLRWTASGFDDLLTVTPSSATGNSTQVAISAEDFSQTRTIEVTFTNQDNASNASTVRVIVVADGPRLGVSSDEVNLTEATPSAKVAVSNLGEGTLRWTASSEDETVKVNPSSATANSREVTISTSDFSLRKTVEVTFTNSDNPSDIKTVAVHVIPDPTELTVSTNTIRLASSAQEGTVTVSNAGGGTLSWTAAVEGALIVTPASDTANSTDVTISAEVFTEPYTAYVTFVNADNAQDYEIVTVSVGPDQFTVTLPGDVDLRMRWVPAGTFMMGRSPSEQDSYTNEDARREVTLSQGFWMGRYQVTKEQWEAVRGTRPWSGRSYVLDEPDTPAVYVSWADAQAFVADLNNLTDLAFRLPTEAEWEYACRAGTTTRFYWGDDSDYTLISNYAWWWGNAYNQNERYAHPVGRKTPNNFGLYDMSGNVWEMCQDWYAQNYPSGPVTDPTGPTSGSTRVIRGGGWGDNARDCRSARRKQDSSLGAMRYYVGFRVSR